MRDSSGKRPVHPVQEIVKDERRIELRLNSRFGGDLERLAGGSHEGETPMHRGFT